MGDDHRGDEGRQGFITVLFGPLGPLRRTLQMGQLRSRGIVVVGAVLDQVLFGQRPPDLGQNDGDQYTGEGNSHY